MSNYQLQQYNQHLHNLRAAAKQKQQLQAEQNYNNIADRVTESSNGNAYYDPLRRLGLMLFAFYEKHYLAPAQADLHPEAVFEAGNSDDPREAYRKLTADRFGSQGYEPPAPA